MPCHPVANTPAPIPLACINHHVAINPLNHDALDPTSKTLITTYDLLEIWQPMTTAMMPTPPCSQHKNPIHTLSLSNPH